MKKGQIQKLARLTVASIGDLNYDNIKAWIRQTYGYNTTEGVMSAETSAITDNENSVIFISSQVGGTYAVSLLLHELGHLVLQHSPVFADEDTRAEIEAEYFVKCALRYATASRYLKPASVSAAALLCCGLSAVLGIAGKRGTVQ